MDAIESAALLHGHGIRDRPSALTAAAGTFEKFMRDVAVIVGQHPELTKSLMMLYSMLTRAQAFHHGALEAIRSSNGYAAFTLIRAYSENAAALVWLRDKPHDLQRLELGAGDAESLKPGRVVDNPTRRAPGIKVLYKQLSDFSHPASRTMGRGWDSAGTDGQFVFRTAPSLSDEDAMWACLWLIEITEMHEQVWPVVFTGSVGRTKPEDIIGALGGFGDPPNQEAVL